MLKKITSFIYIWTLLAILPTSAHTDYAFKHIDTNNGLSQSTVYAILQDQTGFIWMGTKVGLCRYDGSFFKVYSHNNSKLGSDFITSLYQAKNGQIWVGTDQGVWIYTPSTDSFQPFKAISNRKTWITGNVNFIAEHRQKVYIGVNEQGLFIYDLRTKQLQNRVFPHHPNIASIGFSTGNRVWIGFYGGGLWYTSPGFQSLTPFLVNGGQPFKGNIVSAILEENPNMVFIGTDKHGLSIINPKRAAVTDIKAKENGCDIFVRALSVKGKEVWAASEQGLYTYNITTKTLHHYTNDASNPFSLSDNPLYCLFHDRGNGMWMGSYFGGVNYVSLSAQPFIRILPSHTEGKLHGRRVREMVQDAQGQIWIGTEDGGLNYMDTASGVITSVKESAAFPNVHGLCIYGNQLWVGTFAAGLKVVDTQTHRVIKSYQADGKQGALRDNTIFSIAASPQHELYFGTIRGLCKLNKFTEKFEYDRNIPSVLINKVCFDRQGNLWVATQNNGIYLKIGTSHHWIHLTHSHIGDYTLSKAVGLYEDRKGRMWITTLGNGLFCYRPNTRKIEKVSLNGYGTAEPVVLDLVEDQDGFLWISTLSGILKYNAGTKQSQLYSAQMTMLDNQLNVSSATIDRKGNIYFGSYNGIVKFSPSSFKQYYPTPKLIATELMINNTSIDNHTPDSPLQQNIVYTKEIKLAYYQNSFSLRVVPLAYEQLQKYRMEYILEGFTDTWQPVRVDYRIGFDNLPAGKYLLRVRIKNSKGEWDAHEYCLKVIVKPHPLLSLWAKLFYLVCACIMISLIIRYFHRRTLRKRKEAMDKLEQEKEMELYESKINFFTHVAHEIRTPLTLIKGPLEHIIKQERVKDVQTKEDLHIMSKNTDRLNELINQLLDFRKAERDGLKLNFEHCDIPQLVGKIYQRFLPLIREKNIDATLSIRDSGIMAYVDQECFTKIISNLLSNAIKYCASRISILIESAPANTFSVIISNDGNIISKNLRSRIFEPFFRVENHQQTAQTGTGIGLALARNLAELHKGTLTMDENGHLNVFRLTLPLNQTDYIPLSTESGLTNMDEAEPRKPGRPLLLLVDDNAEMLEYEKRTLQDYFDIVLATNGQEALSVLEREKVSLVVTDVMMAPVNGYELCRNIKKDVNYSHTPVILLTAATLDLARMEGMESGADAYIEKPFSMEFLINTITNLLRSREEIKRTYAGSPFVSSDTVAKSNVDKEFLERLRNVMQRHMSNSEFNVDQLASDMNMSRSNLNRKVRGTLNVSPNTYIRIERLKYAAQLLKAGDCKINEVCYKVGFNNSGYFTKCFYAQFGILPKDFIKSS